MGTKLNQMENKQTAMQALVDLLKVKDAYKECMPYIIDIIEEVYLPMEKEQMVDLIHFMRTQDKMGKSIEDLYEQYYNQNAHPDVQNP